MNGKGFFLHVLDISYEVIHWIQFLGLLPVDASLLHIQAGCVSKGCNGCSVTLCESNHFNQ